ncbi:DUF4091 domain-containing protein [Sphingobacterium paludis]|uniref:Uncharacterized protein DUF4091 n=1 Tax=Sphingobacterium paludis TaxID=1476465 RepID=A0A4R7CRR2_9SPHI|nr:DUF4091 domain-containing protein [Sphingobacterium paludis]TDS07515.1 uncharacterized protein DUF4091 [Sphingobacterium paludis]
MSTSFVKSYWLLGCVVWCLSNVVAQTSSPLPRDFQELPDPTSDTLSDWSAVTPGLHSSFVTIDKRFSKSVAPAFAENKQQAIRGWRGERLSAQILLWTSAELKDLRITASAFKNEAGHMLPDSAIQARFVRYVMTDEFGPGCGYRKPQDFASSLVPDMLDDVSTYTVEGKTVRPIWVLVDIPSDASAGHYRGQITVQGPAVSKQGLQLDIEVIDQVLPPPTAWIYHLDQWQHPAAVARVSGTEVWSDAHFDALKTAMQPLADLGQKVITTTLNKDPWNVQTYDPYADMITWTKNIDGSWTYDYTVFDRWVQFMMDLGVKKMINCYSIVPWNNEIHYRDQRQNKLVNVAAKPGTAIFEELWTPFLKDFVKHLRTKGWLEITNIATDERSREEMDAAFAFLSKVCPELGVSYADNQKTYQRYPNSEDISISAGHPFATDDLESRKSRGLNTTFYICCSDGFPNQFTFSEPAESAYLAWYAEAAGFDGMLRWAFNSWVENPLQDSRFRTWPAGDTYIVYPHGRSSIRYERLLEGIQDYEKVQMVKQQLEQKGKREELKQLKDAIAKMNSVVRDREWNTNLNQAKDLLNDLSAKLVN